MSRLTSVEGSVAGKSRVGAVCLRRARRLCAHAAQRITTPYASVTSDGHQKRRRIES